MVAEKFEDYTNSTSHQLSCYYTFSKKKIQFILLFSPLAASQQTMRKCLMKILSYVYGLAEAMGLRKEIFLI